LGFRNSFGVEVSSPVTRSVNNDHPLNEKEKSMKVKKLAVMFSVLVLGLLIGSSMLRGSKTRAAGTCTVPGDYATIQGAASDPGCTTINVAPGVYNESVTVNFSTTINGAQAGNNDFITRNANPAAESTVNGATPIGNVAVFTINAANVTINGFTVKNTVTGGAAMGITVRGGANNAAILNNIIDTITTPDTGGNGTAQAVYLTAGGPDNISISNNEMKNVHSNRSAKGVLVGDNGGTNPSVNVTVQGNSIHDITSDTRGAYGVSVADVTPGTSGLKVLDNTISNLTGGGWAHAIGLEGDTPGVMVNGNSISNLTDLTPSVPSNSIAVFFEVNPSFNTAQVHNNNFNLTAASYGIAVHPAIAGSGSVDGTCNWWGSPTGPTAASNPTGTGAQVSPRVTYVPWLNTPAPGAVCGTIPTDKNQCKDGGWMTLFRADGSTFKNQGDCIQYVNTGK
jgi:hypothetical protein